MLCLDGLYIDTFINMHAYVYIHICICTNFIYTCMDLHRFAIIFCLDGLYYLIFGVETFIHLNFLRYCIFKFVLAFCRRPSGVL